MAACWSEAPDGKARDGFIRTATESNTDRQKQQRAERRTQRAVRVSQHFTELEEEEATTGGQPEGQAPVQPEVRAPEPLVIFEEEMEYSDSTRLALGTLPIYTGTKEEDRPKFLREFALMCENFVRQHNASIRKKLRKFMMKGTQGKVDLLTQKPQELGQNGLTYMKMCQRREMQLNTGKVLSDEALRTFIEDCVENLRIKIFQTRVKEQLRAQFPPPNRVTWKDLEAIIEVQDKLKSDAESWILTFLQEITRRCGCQYSTWEARQHGGLDLKAIKNSIKKI
ncbi:hypothetical protein CYMTET_10425, partial [Cymbomonas tetramitiformis]